MRNSILAMHPVDIYEQCNALSRNGSWLDLEPKSLLLVLGSPISDLAEDKISEVQELASGSDPVVKEYGFPDMIMTFSNRLCRDPFTPPPEMEELCYGIRQISKIMQAIHGQQVIIEVEEGVASLVAALAHYHSWPALPPFLAFAKGNLKFMIGRLASPIEQKEDQRFIDTLYKVVHYNPTFGVKETLAHPDVKSLQLKKNRLSLAKRVINALLYDPVLVYQNSK